MFVVGVDGWKVICFSSRKNQNAFRRLQSLAIIMDGNGVMDYKGRNINGEND